MNVINITSVNSKGCITTLKFSDRKYEILPWDVEIACSSPALKGTTNTKLDDNYVRGFMDDLKNVERDRKGKCQLAYVQEGGFSLTISSVDSLGHFVVETEINDFRNSSGVDTIDNLRISYEIEPSSLSVLIKDFNNLYK